MSTNLVRTIPQVPALGLIHTFEQGPKGGFASVPYDDGAGNWTIGWGHKLDTLAAYDGTPWDLAKADAQVAADLQIAATGVCEALGTIVNTLTDGQYAALIDFTFNVGVDAFSKSSLCRWVVTGAMNRVPAEFMRWTYAKVNGVETIMQGLVNRRKAEVDVWRS